MSFSNPNKRSVPNGIGMPHEKRAKGGAHNEPSSFEDELRLMEEIDDEIQDSGSCDALIDEEDVGPDEADADESSNARWRRPPVPPFDPANDPINFQWIDIDLTSGDPLSVNPSDPSSPVPGAQAGPVPIIRLFGVSEHGNSVCAHVYGFTPYLYAMAPRGFGGTDEELEHVQNFLEQSLANSVGGASRGRSSDEKSLDTYCLQVEFEQGKQSLLGYNFGEKKNFLKIYVALPTLVPSVKRLCEDGIDFGPPSAPTASTNGATTNGASQSQPLPLGMRRCQPFEANVPFILRYMIDREIQGANWLTLPKGSYLIRQLNSSNNNSNNSNSNSSSKGGEGARVEVEERYRSKSQAVTRCQLELDAVFEDMISRPCEGEWNKLAPLRILSTDIECQGRKGHFPEAEHDPVIQIANVVQVQGEAKPCIRNVFTLNTCLPVVGAQVLPSMTEEEMLMKWSRFIVAADPDIITGYNIQNFDVPYLLNRAATLAKNNNKHGASSSTQMKRFGEWGRVRGRLCKMRDTTFQSSAYGKRENIETTIDGRLMFDLLPYMFRNHKLSSYSLNSVSAEFLGQQKEDVHHSIIADLQLGSDADRRRLAVYCLKDAYLPLQLIQKLSVLVNYVEMARVTGVPINFLLSRGQQIKVFSMLLRKCRNVDLLIPTLSRQGGGADGATYEGATVIEPKRDFYQDPIATLDFASLYPSIMQAYNLCYSTLVNASDVARLGPDDYLKSPSGDIFVKSTVRKGVLPVILDELLNARKQAKKDMKAATDPMEKAVQNGRQLALKVSANSVYGFTGATVGQLPCVPIASSTTSYGRELLFKTKSFVEEHYTKANGFAGDAEVVYGDTDSVMVKFGGCKTVAESMPLAEAAADEISKQFPPPIRLEFEKVYWPYLLMNKKRYAGLLWTNSTKYDKMDTKGLETVRRDNCLLVRRVISTCLHKILIERDVNGAIAYSKGVISDLLQNKMDISMLVITKSLGKAADDTGYAAKQAHVELAMRMKKRDPGSAPAVGDRVPYVIIQAAKGAPAYEKSEDPVFVLDNNLPIDTEYYLHNQLSNPLTRLFEPIIKNPKQALLKGDHTRCIAKVTPTAKGGGIMAFAVKKVKCMACKVPLGQDEASDKDKPLCKHCKGREGELYQQKLAEFNKHEEVFSRLWTQCQRCQGSFHQDVLCSNRDCPIFYKRKKVQKDLQVTQDLLERFTW